MKPLPGLPPLSAPPTVSERERLRRLAHELEGVFMNQLFQAMRASVPQGGLADPSGPEAIYTSLMDEVVASQAAQRMQRGIGEALYRQLARRLGPQSGEPAGGADAAPPRSRP